MQLHHFTVPSRVFHIYEEAAFQDFLMSSRAQDHLFSYSYLKLIISSPPHATPPHKLDS